jgi:hypothetical protein
VMKREFSSQKSRFNEKFNEELIEKYLKFAPERISYHLSRFISARLVTVS